MHNFTDLEETVYFWVRNESSVIYHFMIGNTYNAFKQAEIAIADNIGILREFADGTKVAGRCFGDPMDFEVINSLKKRTYENLSEADKKKYPKPRSATYRIF